MEHERRQRPSDDELRAEGRRLAADPDDAREMREVARMMALCSLPVGEQLMWDDEIRRAYLESVLRRELDVQSWDGSIADLRKLALAQVRRDLENCDLVGELIAERRRASAASPE